MSGPSPAPKDRRLSDNGVPAEVGPSCAAAHSGSKTSSDCTGYDRDASARGSQSAAHRTGHRPRPAFAHGPRTRMRASRLARLDRADLKAARRLPLLPAELSGWPVGPALARALSHQVARDRVRFGNEVVFAAVLPRRRCLSVVPRCYVAESVVGATGVTAEVRTRRIDAPPRLDLGPGVRNHENPQEARLQRP
jgi:hypothetical protein